MDQVLHDRIAALPRLDTTNALAHRAACKLCGAEAPLFDVVDMQKHCSFTNQYMFGLSGVQVPYVRCVECGFLFTGFFDGWTEDEWRRYIYNDDYVRVDPEYTGARPARLAQEIGALLRGCEHLRILDYGAGSGIFARDLRAAGFEHVEAYDPFSCPDRPTGEFDLITCMEVLEHTTSPRAALADIGSFLSTAGCLLFSESIQPPDIDDIRGAWWYLAPRNGHISTFTGKSLLHLLPSAKHALHGNGWLWAMAAPDMPAPLAAMVARVGPAIMSYGLAAPASGQDDQWHPAEPRGMGSFRWSRTEHLEWLMPAPTKYPAHVYVRMPYALEISPGFAAACKLTVGGVAADLNVTRSAIVAEAVVEKAVSRLKVTLDTPRPRTPLEVNGNPDGRALGLAVHVA